jgi:hypothetical protein
MGSKSSKTSRRATQATRKAQERTQKPKGGPSTSTPKAPAKRGLHVRKWSGRSGTFAEFGLPELPDVDTTIRAPERDSDPVVSPVIGDQRQQLDSTLGLMRTRDTFSFSDVPTPRTDGVRSLVIVTPESVLSAETQQALTVPTLEMRNSDYTTLEFTPRPGEVRDTHMALAGSPQTASVELSANDQRQQLDSTLGLVRTRDTFSFSDVPTPRTDGVRSLVIVTPESFEKSPSPPTLVKQRTSLGFSHESHLSDDFEEDGDADEFEANDGCQSEPDHGIESEPEPSESLESSPQHDREVAVEGNLTMTQRSESESSNHEGTIPERSYTILRQSKPFIVSLPVHPVADNDVLDPSGMMNKVQTLKPAFKPFIVSSHVRHVDTDFLHNDPVKKVRVNKRKNLHAKPWAVSSRYQHAAKQWGKRFQKTTVSESANKVLSKYRKVPVPAKRSVSKPVKSNKNGNAIGDTLTMLQLRKQRLIKKMETDYHGDFDSPAVKRMNKQIAQVNAKIARVAMKRYSGRERKPRMVP